MSLEPLTIENLDDGRALEKCNEAIERITRDVIERNDLESVRKVTLTIGIKPKSFEAAGRTELCPEINYAVTHNIPAFVGRSVIGSVKLDQSGKDHLLIDTDLPGNQPGQRTIFDRENVDDVDPKTGEVIPEDKESEEIENSHD